jgi:hypothetical protein
MAGALMQLVAYGAQDAYLTTKPEVTFFKVIYKRHTNFAMESMEQTLNGTANFGNKVVCKVSRNGDLMGPCYVEASLPALASSSEDWVNRVGFRLLKQTELRVGGQMIDRHYATWMQVWAELSHTTDQKALLNKLVGTTGVDGAAAGDSAGGAASTDDWGGGCSGRDESTTLKVMKGSFFDSSCALSPSSLGFSGCDALAFNIAESCIQQEIIILILSCMCPHQRCRFGSQRSAAPCSNPCSRTLEIFLTKTS